MPTPYDGKPVAGWSAITQRLVDDHPLKSKELTEVSLASWDAIFASRMGSGFHIGKEILPKPQIMGFLLHELIPLELQSRYPKDWRGDANSADKDIVYVPNTHYSIEVKTSSNPMNIFGNRSYAQPGVGGGKKAKSGYYLTVNFQKFEDGGKKRPEIVRIRFGWLDSTDWIGQAAATGQQSRLTTDANTYKLREIYKR